MERKAACCFNTQCLHSCGNGPHRHGLRWIGDEEIARITFETQPAVVARAQGSRAVNFAAQKGGPRRGWKNAFRPAPGSAGARRLLNRPVSTHG
jgi:hypothetical protein